MKVRASGLRLCLLLEPRTVYDLDLTIFLNWSVLKCPRLTGFEVSPEGNYHATTDAEKEVAMNLLPYLGIVDAQQQWEVERTV
jgi:hypothetical protein